jgi:hypothetical protein
MSLAAHVYASVRDDAEKQSPTLGARDKSHLIGARAEASSANSPSRKKRYRPPHAPSSALPSGTSAARPRAGRFANSCAFRRLDGPASGDPFIQGSKDRMTAALQSRSQDPGVTGSREQMTPQDPSCRQDPVIAALFERTTRPAILRSRDPGTVSVTPVEGETGALPIAGLRDHLMTVSLDHRIARARANASSRHERPRPAGRIVL